MFDLAVKQSGLWGTEPIYLTCVFPDEEKHPTVQEGETLTDYQTRTEGYWIGLARDNMGPDAKDKKVTKVALAMAKVFYEDQ